MRLPIQYAFAYPDRWDAPVPFLDLTRQKALEFHEPAWDDFPVPAPGLSRARRGAQPADRAERGQRGRRVVFSGRTARLHAYSASDCAGDGCAHARAGGHAGRRPPRRRLGPDARGRAGPRVRIEVSVTTLLSFLFVLGVLVFIHELGHFLLARWNGVRVLTFSLGFGPKLLKVQRGDTEYCISAIPLGGYVKMAGENPDDPQTGADDEFLAKSKWQRFQILIAGPAMNILLAVVLLAADPDARRRRARLSRSARRGRRGAAGIAGGEGRHPARRHDHAGSARPTCARGNTSRWRWRRGPSAKSTSTILRNGREERLKIRARSDRAAHAQRRAIRGRHHRRAAGRLSERRVARAGQARRSGRASRPAT